jgi:hypothetical protein
MPTEPNPSAPDDDLPPHLASPEAFARWCREQPEEVRQMEVNARRMELGEFGDLTPEMQATLTKFLDARKAMRDAESHNAAVLAELARVREILAKSQSSLPTGELVQHLEAIEQRIKRCEPIEEEWQQFQLHFTAFQGELMGSIRKRTAMIAMSADAHYRKTPEKFANDTNAQELVKQWRSGMRERVFSELPIADRRELEELERQWRENPPGPGK